MNIKKTKTIGIRTDDHFLKLLESASKMYNASKSEIIRSAVARTYRMPVIHYETIEGSNRQKVSISFFINRCVSIYLIVNFFVFLHTWFGEECFQ
jgi:hypothetical protein